MAENRPGGLTALSIINAVFGVLVLGGTVLTPVALHIAAREGAPENVVEAATKLTAQPTWRFVLYIGLGALQGSLLLLSAVGLWKLQKVRGRYFASAYALITLAGSLFTLIMPPEGTTSTFNLQTILGMTYPLLLLFLVNFVFIDDLTE